MTYRWKTSATQTLLAAEVLANRARSRLGNHARGVQYRLRRTSGAPSAADLNTENVCAAAAKLGAGVERLRNGFLKLTYNGSVSYARSADFEFESLVAYFVCGDKWLTSTLLAEHGLPVAKFGAFNISQYTEALCFFEELPKPVVTKPARDTAGGVGITLDITAAREFRAGFARARAHGGDVLVEQQVAGENVRVTVLDGRILGAVRRVPAYVVGDGEGSVAARAEAKNALWRSRDSENQLLRPIQIDRDVRRILDAQGLTPDSVPERGRAVRLRQVCNADVGGEIVDLGCELHDEQRELAVAAARAVGAVLSGVDLITTDPRAAVASGTVVVNEVNTTPSLYVANAMNNGAPSTYAAECILRYLFGMQG